MIEFLNIIFNILLYSSFILVVSLGIAYLWLTKTDIWDKKFNFDDIDEDEI